MTAEKVWLPIGAVPDTTNGDVPTVVVVSAVRSAVTNAIYLVSDAPEHGGHYGLAGAMVNSPAATRAMMLA
jgi:hypothetical protein